MENTVNELQRKANNILKNEEKAKREMFNQLPRVSLNQYFELTFKVRNSDLVEVCNILEDNKIKYDMEKTGFYSFALIRIRCNLRRAEIIRRLTRHISIYD